MFLKHLLIFFKNFVKKIWRKFFLLVLDPDILHVCVELELNWMIFDKAIIYFKILAFDSC